MWIALVFLIWVLASLPASILIGNVIHFASAG